MKKLNLKMGGIKEMLSREQMKKVVGGDGYGYAGGTCKATQYEYITAGDRNYVQGTEQNLTKEQAMAKANSYADPAHDLRGFWCCDNC